MRTGFSVAVALLIAVAIGFGLYMIDQYQSREAVIYELEAGGGAVSLKETEGGGASLTVTPPEG
ncbi:hypothetical protein SAMN06265173_13415 [Thalassovita litoralis]|jgi:hypothetical protein|uniref:Uncharacterized protein n=1 Tax=Thalassovita litoralis TaxID=1010611 RepID=A0A521FLC2_9RHOB|nr:hypothetical protein [Thalassovita litoralis]SMO97002.1 hypothetical protein SAMN06265173_13415 [Thalassovita litoralis]